MVCRVVGVGQRAGGDDGAGPAVIESLLASGLAGNAELVLVQEPSALMPYLENASLVVIVDAALGAGKAGSVLVLRPEDVQKAAISSVSTHGMSVGQAIELARVLSPDSVCPEIFLVAIAAERPLGIQYGLSDEVKASLPRAVEQIRNLIAEHTHHA